MSHGCALVVALGLIAWSDVAGAAQPAREFEAFKNGWLPSLEEGRALARETGKPLMVVFRCVP